jgi:hypothetical protein
MKSRKFIHYSHNPYFDRLDTPPYSLADGEEYLVEFGEWDGIEIAKKVRGFKISGIFMVNPEWTMINDEGVAVPIPGIKRNHSIWFNDAKDIGTYDTILNDIDTACMDWIKIR